MNWLILTKSSFADSFNGLITVNGGGVSTSAKLWRAVQASLTCVLDLNNQNTGYVHVTTLEEYDSLTGVATGTTKANTSGDPDYISDYIDTARCALPNQTANNVNIAVGNSGKSYLVRLIADNGTGAEYDMYNVMNGGNNVNNVPTGNYAIFIDYMNAHTGNHYNLSTVINGVNKPSQNGTAYLSLNNSAPLTITLP